MSNLVVCLFGRTRFSISSRKGNLADSHLIGSLTTIRVILCVKLRGPDTVLPLLPSSAAPPTLTFISFYFFLRRHPPDSVCLCVCLSVCLFACNFLHTHTHTFISTRAWASSFILPTKYPMSRVNQAIYLLSFVSNYCHCKSSAIMHQNNKWQ